MRGLETEPMYEGKPLSHWACLTQDQNIEGGPSDQAKEAAVAVKAIGADRAIPFLVEWLRPPQKDSVLPGGAVKCFEIFGPEAEGAIPELSEILNRQIESLEESSAQRDAAEALSYLGSGAVPVLLAAANAVQGQQIQWEIINCMAHFGAHGRDARVPLLNWSRDPNAWVRLGALHAYVAIEEDKSAAMEFLLMALKDSDELVRRDAARCLGEVARGKKEALPTLLEALSDPDWQVQTGAIGGLGKIGVEREVVLPLIAEKLQGGNDVVRRCAAFALGEMDGKEAFDVLMGATDDSDGFVREAVFQSLNRIDAEALRRSGKRFY